MKKRVLPKWRFGSKSFVSVKRNQVGKGGYLYTESKMIVNKKRVTKETEKQ
jgi:hypothetical protein